jgi:hypothetical protein
MGKRGQWESSLTAVERQTSTDAHRAAHRAVDAIGGEPLENSGFENETSEA